MTLLWDPAISSRAAVSLSLGRGGDRLPESREVIYHISSRLCLLHLLHTTSRTQLAPGNHGQHTQAALPDSDKRLVSHSRPVRMLNSLPRLVVPSHHSTSFGAALHRALRSRPAEDDGRTSLTAVASCSSHGSLSRSWDRERTGEYSTHLPDTDTRESKIH